jgi:zinc protease
MTPLLRRAAALLVALAAFVPTAAHAIEIETVETPAGLEAWLVPDPSNPMVTVEFAFDGGAALDPEGKAGLATMVAALLDEGAGDLDSQAFQRRLADLAIEMDFDASRDTLSGELTTLTENLDEAFGLLALALSEPRFDADAVERIRGQMRASRRHDSTDPQTLASEAWFAALFPDHPYARPPGGTEESIAALTVEDLRAFARDSLTRAGLSIGVAGDITPERLAALVDKAFAALPASAPEGAATVPEGRAVTDGGTTVLTRPVPQSVAVFGHGGIARGDDDWYAAYVVNYILGGGGFASRLMDEVREQRGLAYSVYSYLVPLDHGPVWMGGVATNNAQVAESLALIRAEWRRMAEEGPTAEELADAKRYLTGAWPLRFSSSGAIASILVAMQREGLPPAYLNERNALIEAVTLDDARRVAARLMDPEALTTVVVGQPEGLPASN